MAISTYGELKTALVNWQYGAGTLNAVAGDLVTLAQGYLNRRLRTRYQITQTDISPTEVTYLYALPSNYLQVRHVTALAAIRRRLTYITLEGADAIYPERPSGEGAHYTIIGSNIQVFPTMDDDIELTYYASLAAFSQDEDTDWLLTRMPNLYLSACQMYAAEFLKDDAEIQKQATIVDMYIAMLNSESMAGEIADATFLPESLVV